MKLLSLRAGPLGLLVIGSLAAACGSAEVKTTPEVTPAAEPVTVTEVETVSAPAATTESATTTEEAPATTEAAPASGDAGVGDTISVNGSEDGSNASAKLLKVERWAGSEYSRPEQGLAFWTIRVQITNTGTTVLDDCDTNDFTMTMNTDEEADGAFATRNPDLGCFKLRPGKKRVGWIAYQAPKKSKPASLQFALNSGYADEIAEWSLR